MDILKTGLSGIAKRYGYQNVQEFYKIYHKSHNAYTTYMKQVAEWDKAYEENIHRQGKESVHKQLKYQPTKAAVYQQ